MSSIKVYDLCICSKLNPMLVCSSSKCGLKINMVITDSRAASCRFQQHRLIWREESDKGIFRAQQRITSSSVLIRLGDQVRLLQKTRMTAYSPVEPKSCLMQNKIKKSTELGQHVGFSAFWFICDINKKHFEQQVEVYSADYEISVQMSCSQFKKCQWHSHPSNKVTENINI